MESMRFGIYSTNNYLHIYNRGVSKKKIFKHDHDYRYFWYFISKYIHRFNLKIEKGCIMPNHFHFLIKCPKSSKVLSKFMQLLQISYARYFNKTYDHSGHVFQGQYKFAVFFNDSSLNQIKKYIDQNPVKAGLVKNPEDWPYRI